MNSSNTRNLLFKRLTTLGVLLCLIGTGAFVLSDETPEVTAPLPFQMAAALPSDCLLHVAFDGVGDDPRFHELAISQLAEEPQMQRFLQPALEMVEMMSEEMFAEVEQNLGLSVEELVGALEGGLTFTLVDLDMGDGNAPPMFDIILTADLGANEDLVAKVAGLLNEGVRDGMGLEPAAVKIGGHEGFSVNLDGIDVSWVIAGQHLLVGTQPETMAAVAGRVKAGSVAGGLMENPSFAKASARTSPGGSSIFMAYADVAGLIGLLDSMPIDDDVPVAAIIDFMGLDSIDSCAYSLSAEGRAFVDRIWIGAPKGFTGIYAGMKHRSDSLRTMSFAPENSLFYSAFRFELDPVANGFLDFVGTIEPRAKEELSEGLAEANKQFGFSILDDFIPTIGTEWGVWAAPSPYGGLVPEFVLALELDAPDRFTEYLGAILQQTAGEMVQAFEFMGRQVNYVDTGAFMNDPDAFGVGIKPCWMIHDGFLFLAAAPQTLKNMLVSNRDGRPSMTSNTDLGNSLSGLRRFNQQVGTDAISYVDLASIAMMAIDTLAPIAQSAHLPEEVPVDMTQFPTSDVFKRHLFGLTGSSYYAPDGLLSEIVSPMGYLSFVAGFAAGAGAVMIGRSEVEGVTYDIERFDAEPIEPIREEAPKSRPIR